MHRLLVLAAVLLPCAAAAADDEVRLQPFLDLETGALWATRNDAAVPGDTGTRFSMAGADFSTKTAPFVRLQAGLRFGRHRLSATFAPIRLQGNGVSDIAILFKGQTFFTSNDATVHYKFDTYRLTYRFALVDTSRLDLELGLTALLRDAEIRLSQGGSDAAEKNVGFVPLISFRAAVRVAGPFRVALDGDALAAKQGRAEDVSLALEFATGDLIFRAGYRFLEGGVDTSQVFNSAWLNQAMVGVRYYP